MEPHTGDHISFATKYYYLLWARLGIPVLFIADNPTFVNDDFNGLFPTISVKDFQTMMKQDPIVFINWITTNQLIQNLIQIQNLNSKIQDLAAKIQSVLYRPI